jgi:hypothetical protein
MEFFHFHKNNRNRFQKNIDISLLDFYNNYNRFQYFVYFYFCDK